MADLSNGIHPDKQPSARLTLRKIFGVFVSLTARALPVKRDAKTSKNSNGVLSESANLKMMKLTDLATMPVTINLRSFKLIDLEKATSNFIEVLGKGGSRNVYKGWVHEISYDPSTPDIGLPVAVKRFSPEYEQHEKWQMEIDLSKEYSHPNFVKLLGYCSEGQERLLVYEYMQNSDLDSHIFKPSNKTNETVRKALRWEARLNIMIGAARCLAFFHTDQAKQVVICGDLKTSRILLDGKFNAKLSPSGLKRATQSKHYANSTACMVGTLGYAAPEYLKSNVMSLETDVYAFGVVLLELMTGIRASEMLHSEDSNSLGYHIEKQKRLLHYSNNLNLDPWLEDSLPEGTEHDIASLIAVCIDDCPSKRPSMLKVVERLERISDSCKKYFMHKIRRIGHKKKRPMFWRTWNRFTLWITSTS
ncbi:putative serine/threonine-protein kinase PIX7 [Heracleum sosnowskyi]|uniref:Serine/threonine-protein kinase PIX7 n=1 Tax=Heracleum sosnowskyi TaxID=360622 RepID=A0AAD8N411_9APIA|nr:putative serine/threonine-protein kinase PIX7 [Heracleum sosnowskyi]